MSSQHADLSTTEEELHVFIEFDDSVNIDKYGNIHVLGIDTKSPIIQLDDTFFTGIIIIIQKCLPYLTLL